MARRIVFLAFAAALLILGASSMMAEKHEWVLLGTAHVDGQHDHDVIDVGRSKGRYDRLRIDVANAPIEFDHIVVHYGNGSSETLNVRDVIKPGKHSRDIKLEGGDRIIESFEVWYSKANPASGKPELQLFGRTS
jgi:hypothetical protein